MEYTCAGGAADHSRSRRGAGPTEESVLSTHPLSRLFAFARPYRRNAVLATVYSVLNKFFDVLPELLIGVAVDVVVNQKQSFLAGLGIEDPMHQLGWLTALTILIWVFESVFEYLYSSYPLQLIMVT